MKIAITSPGGDPLEPRTWSAAPANLAAALKRAGCVATGIDSSLYKRWQKAVFIPGALARGLAVDAVSWTAAVRKRRGAFVAAEAARRGVDHILCAGSLDVPPPGPIPYSVWMDNTWHLLCRGATAPGWAKGEAFEYVDRLERKALAHAHAVLPFSEHVRADVVGHYDVPAEQAIAVGCGSGEVPPFTGEKRFADGHVLFVAKHLFAEKGGEIALAAFEIVRERRPETRFVVVGSDAVVARLRGRPGVEAHGWIDRDTLNGFFHGAAMLLQPMLADPWGQVYLEAMKARAVVVSLDVAALPELTDNGRLGVLVDDPDPQRIADAVLATFARPQSELDAITREAQERTLRRYDWDAVAQRVIDALSHRDRSVRADHRC